MSKKRFKFKRSDLRFVLLLLLLSLICVFIAFYSYGKLNPSDVKSVEIKISNVQEHYAYPIYWITFQSSDGTTFYCRTDNLKQNKSEIHKELLETLSELENETIEVSYTHRKDLNPMYFLYFNKYKRVVTLSFKGDSILVLEQYNRANFDYRVSFLLLSLPFLIFAGFYFWLMVITSRWYITKHQKGKSRKKKRR